MPSRGLSTAVLEVAGSAAYTAAWALALPLVLARFWWRGRMEPAYRLHWGQRLGHWSGLEAPSPARPRVWLHAVSLGETRAALPLVQALRQAIPDMQLLLTTGTATGWAAGQALLQPGDLHGWVPLDTRAATRRFFQRTRPQVGVLMETETWPHLLRAAQEAGVPVALANARLSERSLRKGQRWAALSQPMMARLAAVWAQTPADAQRLTQAGAVVDRVRVCGNLKYDLTPAASLLQRGQAWRRPAGRRVVMAASWREGEDTGLIQAWQSSQSATRAGPSGAVPRPLLLLVPRHPQRFDEVEAALRSAGLTVSRRSQWGPHGPSESDRQADVWLGDSVGEMAAYYAAADVALLGGSFAALGGQNLIEAAACGCPVIMGPHTFNFEEASRVAVEDGAATRVVDLAQAVQQALTMSEPALQAQRAAGLALCARHAGAASRQAQAVAALIEQARQGPANA